MNISIRLLTALALVLCVTLIATSTTGCYSRAQLPTKATPAASKIFMEFRVDPSARNIATTTQTQASGNVGDVANQLNEANQQLANALSAIGGGGTTQNTKSGTNQQMLALVDQLPASLTSTLKRDFLQKRVAYPVNTIKDADLHLTGTFRFNGQGIVLDWQMTEIRANAVVSAGTETSYFFTGNVDPFADNILASLLGIDIDAYAANTSNRPTTPTAPTAPNLANPPKSNTDGSKTWVVAIGIESYRDDLPKATHAENDARAFVNYAKTTLGVPESQIKLLTGNRAARGDIASVLEEWLPRNARQPGGKVYVYFSGHGAPDPATGEAYLVPYDADPAYLKTRGYSIKKLYEKLNALPNQNTVAFLDACFSGSGTRSVIPKGTRPLVPVTTPNAPKSVIAYAAAAANQTTGAAPKARHGLFTYHLLTGLYGDADSNNDRNVSMDELERYVSANVSKDARLDNREQSPSLTLPARTNAASVVLVQGLQK